MRPMLHPTQMAQDQVIVEKTESQWAAVLAFLVILAAVILAVSLVADGGQPTAPTTSMTIPATVG